MISSGLFSETNPSSTSTKQAPLALSATKTCQIITLKAEAVGYRFCSHISSAFIHVPVEEVRIDFEFLSVSQPNC